MFDDFVLTVGSHGVVNGDWVGMGLFVCVMSDSISDLVVGNRDWSGGCPFVSIKGWFGGDSGLLVRVV